MVGARYLRRASSGLCARSLRSDRFHGLGGGRDGRGGGLGDQLVLGLKVLVKAAVVRPALAIRSASPVATFRAAELGRSGRNDALACPLGLLFDLRTVLSSLTASVQRPRSCRLTSK